MEEPVKLAIDATSVATLKELLSSRGLVAPIGISEYPLPDGRRVSVTVQPFSLWTTDNEIALLEGESVLHVGSHQAANQLLGWGGAKDGITLQLRARDDVLTGYLFFRGRLYAQELDDTSIVYNPPSETPSKVDPNADIKKFIKSLEPRRKPSVERFLADYCCIGGPAGVATQMFDLAIETDDEFYAGRGSLDAVVREVEDLVAAVNTIYFRDTDVLFRLRWLGMYTGMVPDPYDAQGNFGLVSQLRAEWQTNWSGVPRDMTVLLSGRALGGNSTFYPWRCQGGERDGQWCVLNPSNPSDSCGTGLCQWVGESLCDTDRSYVVIEDAGTHETKINNTAHELAHLSGAEHTNCIMEPNTNQYVDRCVSDQYNLRGLPCYSGPPYGPGPIYTPSFIMSYCGPPSYPHALAFHAVNARTIGDAAQRAGCAKPATVVTLQKGQPVVNLASFASNQITYHYFAIDVPTGANRLDIETYGGTGEVLLYARFGSLPTTFGTLASAVPATTQQTIVQNAPRAGTWYVLLWSNTNFSNVTLTADYQP
jgi:hypothetical protein